MPVGHGKCRGAPLAFEAVESQGPGTLRAIGAIGLMSGTSMDGIDVAMLVTDGESELERGRSLFIPYDAAFRRRLAAALEPARAIRRREERPGGLDTLEAEITNRHADAVRAFLAAAPAGEAPPELIGFHGQTVLHRPEAGLTVQLGDGALLARLTGLPVMFDMRANDMAHGGQGAPLVPAYHAALAGVLPAAEAALYPKVFVNIGGISNVTYVPRRGDPLAFDSGPGNALIDQWVAREGGVPYDADGAIASEGGVIAAVVARYLDLPFFSRSGPKSLDRNDFSLDLAGRMELADGARTLAAVTAAAILAAAGQMPERPALWIVSGGGARNPHILADLGAGAEREGARVATADALGLNGDSMEAEAWAYLAVRARAGLPITFPTTTGVPMAVGGGVLALPDKT